MGETFVQTNTSTTTWSPGSQISKWGRWVDDDALAKIQNPEVRTGCWRGMQGEMFIWVAGARRDPGCVV